ncbi:hypothetical protein BKA81DRAFT_371006 [Phyllosticta paracitricarpa]
MAASHAPSLHESINLCPRRYIVNAVAEARKLLLTRHSFDVNDSSFNPGLFPPSGVSCSWRCGAAILDPLKIPLCRDMFNCICLQTSYHGVLRVFFRPISPPDPGGCARVLRRPFCLPALGQVGTREHSWLWRSSVLVHAFAGSSMNTIFTHLGTAIYSIEQDFHV